MGDDDGGPAATLSYNAATQDEGGPVGAAGSVSAEGFSAPQVCVLAGLSYRRVDYWARTGLLEPSLQAAHGCGSRRRYSYRDVVQLKVIRRLLDAQVSLRLIRQAVAFLRTELDEDLASATLVLNGTHSLLVRRESDLLDILRQGQAVLSVVHLRPLADELDAAIAVLNPASGPAPAQTSAA